MIKVSKKLNYTTVSPVTNSVTGDTCVITCHFNWAGFKSPVRNLNRFLLECKREEIPVFGAEAYLDKPVTKDFPNWIHVKATNKNICFQKEALLNLVVKNLPKKYTKVIICDHDVWFENKNWFSDTSKALDRNDVVQPYKTAIWRGSDGFELHRKRSFLSSPEEGGHPGFAIACRRKVLEETGFYPYCILGGGDIIFAATVSGQFRKSSERNKTYYKSHDFLNSEWFKIASERKYSCGFVEGVLYHEFHGAIKDRQYNTRNSIVKKVNPSNISISKNGLVEINQSINLLPYFKNRNEDGNVSYKEKEIVTDIYDLSASVVVTCHSEYAKRIGDVLKSIDRQTKKFKKKIIVLDGFNCIVPKDWAKITVNTKNPNVNRNKGLELVQTEWCIFWDGDNIMPSNYLEGMSLFEEDESIGFVYPCIKYIRDGRVIKQFIPPEYDYWLNREKTFVDTSSLWRVSALRKVNGFSKNQPKFDDFALSLKVSRAGYVGLKSETFTQITQHKNRRSGKIEYNLDAIWNAYSFAIVTAFAQNYNSELFDWYKQAELPPNHTIYWYCNFKDEELLKKLKENRTPNTIIRDSGDSWDGSISNHKDQSRHMHVASMYNRILSQIDDDMIMMIEDDNIGPANGIKKLLECFKPWKHEEKTAMAGGKYRSRSNPICCCASTTVNKWTALEYKNVPDKVIKISMMGGGFTLYSNSAIKKSFPIVCTNNGGLIGWDGNLGMSFEKNGYKSFLDCSVKVKHMCKQVIKAYENRKIGNI